MKQESKSLLTQWIPSIIYWNVRLLSKNWETSQSDIIQEAVLEWMSKKGLKTQDYYKENKPEFNELVIKHGGSKFRDQSLKGIPIRGISVNKLTSLNLTVASLQTQKPKSGILTQAIIDQLEKIGWTFLTLEEAKIKSLTDDSIKLTGEMMDSSESVETDDIYDKLFYKLDKKELIKEGQRYTYDDLLSIKAQNEEVEELSPEVESEATEAMDRINKLLNKEGG